MNRSILLLPLLFVAVDVQGQSVAPFGFTPGDSPEMHGCTKKKYREHEYACEEVKKPHPELTGYSVIAYPEVGIAVVKAAKDLGFLNWYNAGDAEKIRAEIRRLAGQLVAKYGTWTVADFEGFNLYHPNQQATRSHTHNVRLFANIWKFEKGELKEITLSITQNALFETFIIVEFEFSNMDRYNAIQNRKGVNSF